MNTTNPLKYKISLDILRGKLYNGYISVVESNMDNELFDKLKSPLENNLMRNIEHDVYRHIREEII